MHKFLLQVLISVDKVWEGFLEQNWGLFFKNTQNWLENTQIIVFRLHTIFCPSWKWGQRLFLSYANASHLSLGESRGVATSLFTNGTAKVSLWYILWLLYLQWFKKLVVQGSKNSHLVLLVELKNGAIWKGQIDH